MAHQVCLDRVYSTLEAAKLVPKNEFYKQFKRNVCWELAKVEWKISREQGFTHLHFLDNTLIGTMPKKLMVYDRVDYWEQKTNFNNLGSGSKTFVYDKYAI